jgi:hypothetical protein
MVLEPALFINTATVGCIGLLLIGALLVYLFWRKRRIGNELEAFHPRHGLVPTDTAPAAVLAELGDPRWYCYSGTLTSRSGEPIPFHWWEGEMGTTEVVGDTARSHINHYLAVSFPPGVVSKEFISKVKEVTTAQAEATGAVKKFFVFDTTNPYRVETLADGTFLIVWQSLRRADIYEEKIQFFNRILNELPVKKELERDTMAEILISAPEDSRPQVLTLMQVLDSMNRDYHDTKAHPLMTLDDHAAFYKLDPEQTQFVKNSIQLTITTRADLLAAGFDVPEADGVRNEAAVVNFPHRTMTYLIPQNIYIDMNPPGKIYV